MKVLVVTPYPIAPLTHGGRVRTSRLGAALARAGAEVDVLCPWRPGVPWRPFRRDGVTYHPHAFATNVLPAVLDGRVIPPLVALSWQPFQWGPAQRFRRVGPCDIVQFDFCAYAAWMERVQPSARVVYSAHNVEYDFAQARTRRSIVGDAALRRLAALESRAVRASALVVTCTAADAERMRDLYGGTTRFEVIPNGFDEALLDGDRRRERERARAALGIAAGQVAIVFVGGPAQHNRDGARFLEHELMPRLGEWARLLIAGQCGGGRGEARGGAVRRLGYVEDLKALYAAADIAVNPVAYGSGSSVKIAEYLAAGLPIVTTPVGARGYEHLGGRLCVTSLPEFAAAVENLRPSRPGDLPASREPAWTELGRCLYAAYARLLADGASPGTARAAMEAG
jgi:glycosyltransferase involved in cell wall biosynthesis